MIRRLFAATVLLAALAAPATVLAQAEAPVVAAASDEGGCSPIWGYLAFGALVGLALMILFRSSRRT